MNKTLDYFNKLIDEQGIIQFSNGPYKDYRYGYAIEDQARALIVSLQLKNPELTELFISLIKQSIDPRGVKMLWDIKGEFEQKVDDFGEASAEVIWALGDYLKKHPDQQIEKIYQFLTDGIINSQWPRAWAYALLGTTKVEDHQATKLLADKLTKKYIEYSTDQWPWFEEKITYANALFPWSLIESYKLLKDPAYKKIGLACLEFLFKICTKDSVPVVVGNQGWWRQGQPMPLYGQQPIDLAYLSLCCLAVYDLTKDKYYLDKALFYYSWFFGNNLKQTKMIRLDGGCYDGLNSDGVNPNAGAESTVCFLMATQALQPYLAHSASNSYISPTI